VGYKLSVKNSPGSGWSAVAVRCCGQLTWGTRRQAARIRALQ